MGNVRKSQPCVSMNFCTEYSKAQIFPCEYSLVYFEFVFSSFTYLLFNCRSSVFNVNFEHISIFFLDFLLPTLNRQMFAVYIYMPAGLPLECKYNLQYQQQQQNNELQTRKTLPIHD